MTIERERERERIVLTKPGLEECSSPASFSCCSAAVEFEEFGPDNG